MAPPWIWRSLKGRAAIAFEVRDRLQQYLDDYATGIRVSTINIDESKPPAQVQGAFDDVIKAREDEERVKNEAQSYANGIVPEARGRAQQMEVNAYRDQVIARADLASPALWAADRVSKGARGHTGASLH